MMNQPFSHLGDPIPPLFVVSSSMATLGEQVARTVLPQFRDVYVPLKVFRRVQQEEQLEEIVAEAVEVRATIIHTIANPDLRQFLINLAVEREVVAIDIVGPLIERLTEVLGVEPIGKPGLYRELHEAYFRRIEAIGYTLKHDDGLNHKGWPEAEIIIVGVSRIGKTPLSLYLSMLGWKVANIPLVPNLPPHQDLFKLDRRRMIGLTIDPVQLQSYREHRQRHLGTSSDSDYTNLQKIYEETEEARRLFRRNGFRIIDVTNKPIETTAGQVIDRITKQLRK